MKMHRYYNGKVLTINGVKINMTPEEANEIVTCIIDYRMRERKKWEAAQEAAGQIWITHSFSYGSADEDRFYSLEEAAGYLISGSNEGVLSCTGGRISCPDGTTIEGEEMWKLLDEVEAKR